MQEPYRRDAATEGLCWRAIKRLWDSIFPSCRPTHTEIASALGVGKNNGPLGQAPDAEYGTAELYAVYVAYVALMGAAGYHTFDDQVLLGLTQLRTNPDLQQRRASFGH